MNLNHTLFLALFITLAPLSLGACSNASLEKKTTSPSASPSAQVKAQATSSLAPSYHQTNAAPSSTEQSTPPSKHELNDAAELNVKLGLYYLQQQNYPTAKAKFLLALAQAPRNPLIYDALGYFYEKTNDAHAAESYYKKALNLAPKSGLVHNNYGAFLYREHRCLEALREFKLALADPYYINSAAARKNVDHTTSCLQGEKTIH